LSAQQPTDTLPEITVSAVREQRSIFTVPLAVTRVDARSVFGRAGVGLDDALRDVPGVFAQSRSGGVDVRIVIRGYGARGAGDRSNAGTSRGVRVLLDGVPETEPDGRTAFDNVDLGAITGVEVIRSNASALYGNAAGGVVSLSTLDLDAPPSLDAELQAGGFGLRRMILRGSSRSGSGAVAASLVRTAMDGWRARSAGDRWLGTFSASGALGYRTRLGVFAVATDNAYQIPGPLTRPQLDADPRQANPAYAARFERRHNRLGRVAVSVDHAIGEEHAVSGLAFVGPKFLQRSERNTFRDFTRYHLGGNLVWRWRPAAGASRDLMFMAGVDEALQDGAVLFYTLSPDGNRGDSLTSNQREGASNFGAFAQASLELARRLSLSLGARYDAIRYHAEDRVARLSGARTFSRVSPKIGLSYRVGRSHSVYASLGGGVEVPAGNETDPASTFGQDTVSALNPLLDPIHSTTVEVGTRQTLSLGRGFLSALSYDVALYRTRVTNEIVPYRGGRFYFTAGEASRSGAELGVALIATRGFSARGSLTLNRHRYTEYVVDSVHYGVPGAFADYSGNRVVGVPALMHSLSLSWHAPGALPFMIRATGHGTADYWVDDANTVEVPGATTVDLTAGLDDFISLGSIGVRGFVTINNLFDRRYIAAAFLNPDVVGGEPVAYEPGLPRHVVVSLALGRR
jgi:iron complex outermembrane receptor protein